MTEVDEPRLVERMRRGDEDAFAALYTAHHPPIYRYAAQMCGAAAADDVVQETFMALLRQPFGYDAARGSLLNYLFGIARHHVVRRMAASRSESPLDEGDEQSEDAFASPLLTPFEDLSRAETVDLVRAAIQSLPPLYREVVALCELQELDYGTAASIIGCPIGTVRSRLHRARALLASKLARVPVGVARPFSASAKATGGPAIALGDGGQGRDREAESPALRGNESGRR